MQLLNLEDSFAQKSVILFIMDMIVILSPLSIDDRKRVRFGLKKDSIREGDPIYTIVKGSVQLQSGNGRFDEDRYDNLIIELTDIDQYIPQGTIYTKVRERIVVPETACRLLTDKGSEKENTKCLYNNIAVVYYAQGNYEKALEYLEKALTNSEKVLGREHPDAAAMYHNIALMYSILRAIMKYSMLLTIICMCEYVVSVIIGLTDAFEI